jgi:hypothetical protein
MMWQDMRCVQICLFLIIQGLGLSALVFIACICLHVDCVLIEVGNLQQMAWFFILIKCALYLWNRDPIIVGLELTKLGAVILWMLITRLPSMLAFRSVG